MKVIPPLVVGLLGVFATGPLFAQGVLLEAKVEFDHVSYDSAIVDAQENYDGDLLIYFFQENSSNHTDVLARALNESTLAQYINRNFARIAIDAATPEGKETLLQFRTVPDWSFITVQRTFAPYPEGTRMHGWGNIRNDADVEQWLTRLRWSKQGSTRRRED